MIEKRSARRSLEDFRMRRPRGVSSAPQVRGAHAHGAATRGTVEARPRQSPARLFFRTHVFSYRIKMMFWDKPMVLKEQAMRCAAVEARGGCCSL